MSSTKVTVTPTMAAIPISDFPKEVQQALLEFDDNGDGMMSPEELQNAVNVFKKTQVASGAKDIPISLFPKDVQSALNAFDMDGDGTVGTSELAAAAKMYQEKKKEAKRMKWGLVASVLIIVLLAVSNFATSLIASEASKESHTDAESGRMTSLSGQTVATVEATETMSLYQVPLLPIEELQGMRTIGFFVDYTSEHGGWAETVTNVCSSFKIGDEKVLMETCAGNTLTIDAEKRVITFTKGSTTYKAAETEPSSGRLLATAGRQLGRRGLASKKTSSSRGIAGR